MRSPASHHRHQRFPVQSGGLFRLPGVALHHADLVEHLALAEPVAGLPLRRAQPAAVDGRPESPIRWRIMPRCPNALPICRGSPSSRASDRCRRHVRSASSTAPEQQGHRKIVQGVGQWDLLLHPPGQCRGCLQALPTPAIVTTGDVRVAQVTQGIAHIALNPSRR